MPPIRDKFTIHSKAVVCQDVELKGDITIGSGSEGTIVHPKATIFAIAGPIVIGMGCIIEEGAILVNRRKEVMRIGDDNLFEIGCRAGVLLVPTEDQALEDYTVVYGPAAEQRTWSGRGKVQEADLRRKHAEYLREMLPKFNRLRRGDGA
ncbi:hypothetical protein CVT25_001059 [Psilocybe cyanescens]|uniref:Dynactin subunit 6 n=1 Tax=Psilocybe cyanescens TaxID=93625 RepID=A0A409XB74_PSICY|nr:hypothetical protein CVT25_001059 [Psilocybe cyanescens]